MHFKPIYYTIIDFIKEKKKEIKELEKQLINEQNPSKQDMGRAELQAMYESLLVWIRDLPWPLQNYILGGGELDLEAVQKILSERRHPVDWQKWSKVFVGLLFFVLSMLVLLVF